MDMMRSNRTPLVSLFLTTVAVAASWTPADADACGGTFCDAGPNAMPVDQTGENILFAMGEGYTEAHIQIQYDPTTEAEQFAWVVPMTAVPTFSVGSQRLFDNVLQGTVPAYGFNRQFDSCGDPGGTGGSDPTGAGSGDPGGGETGSDSGGPSVVLQETVGAFDITVLQGGTAAEVMEWLGANGYQQDPAAEPILAEYLAENYLFAAFRLTNGAETAEIHPITLRFEVEEACVPLRLTRIAAVDDMEVRTFFLAADRVVPQTYKHVVVNPLQLDWPNFAANYKEVITLAVDAFGAEGKAFVTEYAGPSDIVSPFGLYSKSWDSSAFEGMAAVEVVDALVAQGLRGCDDFEGTCAFSHALLEGLMASYLPVPAGVDADEFYDCLTCFEDQIDLEAWGDGSAFATAMEERIVVPGLHAQELLAQFPTLTRMYTTISPAEMTADPFFWQNPTLPNVDLTQSVAQRRVLCNGDALWTLPDGREVYVPNDGAWPVIDDAMPWEQEVAEMPSNGAPLMLVDNGALIDTQLATYNCALGWPANQCGSGDDVADTGGRDTDGGTSGGDTAGETGGSGGLDDDGGGCGCNTTPPAHAALWAFGVLALRRRRRGSSAA
jgi:MYXO-CTERM domain-containing protein